MQIDPQSLPWQSMYKLMIGSIVPRPIGWISTVDENGRPNLAPYSFFNAVCSNPPTVLFCPARRPDGSIKDSFLNVQTTGEFVVNIVTEATAQAMNLTSAELPYPESEFEYAGLTPVPSVHVRPPRVAESPVNFECRVQQIININDAPGGGSIVIGRVVYIHIADEILLAPDKVDPALLQAVGRMGGPTYITTRERFDMLRPVVKR